MNTAVEVRNSKLGPKVVKALKNRMFEAWYFDKPEEALDTIVSLIPKDHLVSWGGSVSAVELGVQDRLARDGYKLLDRDKAASPEERLEMMRQAMFCDTYLMSANAISEDGQLINIDGNGNRIAAMIYGPRQVIVIAGMNKVAKTLDDAMVRARTIAAPLNQQRFPSQKSPCNETGSCANCIGPNCICSHIVTTRLCKPAGRIKVILVGKDLGL
jgi:L-lactate utilization protein LutB